MVWYISFVFQNFSRLLHRTFVNLTFLSGPFATLSCENHEKPSAHSSTCFDAYKNPHTKNLSNTIIQWLLVLFFFLFSSPPLSHFGVRKNFFFAQPSTSVCWSAFLCCCFSRSFFHSTVWIDFSFSPGNFFPRSSWSFAKKNQQSLSSTRNRRCVPVDFFLRPSTVDISWFFFRVFHRFRVLCSCISSFHLEFGSRGWRVIAREILVF